MTHDADKLIRQLSLVAYLMAEQRPVTARDVKSSVEGYAEMGDEAFARRFYADRSELQALGVPITSQRDEFTGEELYNLREEQYFLPPVDLSDDELAALQTSLHLLEGQFAYAEPLRLALQNLALGRGHALVDPGPKTATVDLLGSRYSADVAQRLAKLENAISKQRTVRFSYLTMERERRAERSVNPYGLYELNGAWYLVGEDTQADEEPRRKTFRVSRIQGDIRFATRRERDFRLPADFDVTAYRDRPPWRLASEPQGTATLAVSADATWLVERLHGRHGEMEELLDGSGRFTTDYSDERMLSSFILGMAGRLRPLQPPSLVAMVEEDLERIVELHSGPPRQPPPQAAVAPAPEQPARPAREAGPVAPERFALLQALLAFLLERCGEAASVRVEAAELRERFRLSEAELAEHLELLNLVNFGGGCYAVYARLEDAQVAVEKELYGDTFRRPARLSPLEAKALLRALDVVAPLIAAEAHTSLDAVRGKIEAAFGRFSLSDTPAPHHADAEEAAVTVLNEGLRERQLVRLTYLSRSSNELSERLVEPYLLRRGENGWSVECYDRSRSGRRTFRVSYIRDAELAGERFEPRPEMADLLPELGGDVGTATVLFGAERARYELEERPQALRLTGGEALDRITYGSRAWLVSEILRRRGAAELLEPERLRAEVVLAARALQAELAAVAAS